MKKTMFAVIMTVLVTVNAKADGFKCQSVDGDLNVKVYNHTDPSAGTRVASVMVLSDAAVQSGSKTIATFTEVSSLLNNSGASYDAKVDLRYKNSRRGGEYIGGTRLMFIDTISLDVDFAYNLPVPAGKQLDATLTIAKRDGELTSIEMTCERYLKN